MFFSIDQRLASVKVTHPALIAHRTTQFRSVTAGMQRSDIATALIGNQSDETFERRIGNYTRRDPACPSIHICIALERAKGLPEATIYGALYYTEQGNFKILKREYGLQHVPQVLNRKDPLELPESQSGHGSLIHARTLALQAAANEKGLKNAHQIAVARYPHYKTDDADLRLSRALEKRLSPTLQGKRLLNEQDALELAPVLGPPSRLLVSASQESAPDVDSTREVPRESPRRAATKAAASASDEPRMTLAIPEFGVTLESSLGSFDIGSGSFSLEGQENVQVRLLRNGTGCLVDVRAQLRIPPESLPRLLTHLLPKA